MDLFAKAMQEEAEVKSPETSLLPKCFDGLKEVKDNPDAPVATNEVQEKPITYINTIKESLEGTVHEVSSIPYERKQIESGEKTIEGVFPVFDAAYEVTIPEELFKKSDYIQFKYCNEQLNEAIQSDSKLKSIFSDEQLEQIEDGISDGGAPDGYVWHHDAEVGKLQLVDSNIHSQTGHTGGRAVWGGGNECR